MFEYKVVSIIKVVDGDTVDLEVDLGHNVFIKERYRLYGIDAPETNRRASRYEGLKSKEWLVEKLVTALIYGLIIHTVKTRREKDKKGKYGRYLASLIVFQKGKELDLNKLMVAEGFAKFVEYK